MNSRKLEILGIYSVRYMCCCDIFCFDFLVIGTENIFAAASYEKREKKVTETTRRVAYVLGIFTSSGYMVKYNVYVYICESISKPTLAHFQGPPRLYVSKYRPDIWQDDVPSYPSLLSLPPSLLPFSVAWTPCTSRLVVLSKHSQFVSRND